MNEAIQSIIISLLSGAAVFVSAAVGYGLKKLKEYFDQKEIMSLVEIGVRATEQTFRQLKGADKLEKAKDSIVDMLDSRGLTVSDTELELFIESVVSGFNYSFCKSNGETAPENKK